MRKNFKFRGGMDAHYFFYVVGEGTRPRGMEALAALAGLSPRP